MDPVPVSLVAFPALWFFLLGFLLALGVVKSYRERHDLKDDWNRLVLLHDALTRTEATGGHDGDALLELRALAEAIDESVPPPPGRPELAAQVEKIAPGQVPGAEIRAAVLALRQDILAADRTLQERMRRQAKSQGHVGRLFLAGVGAVLLVPLDAAGALGLVRRYFARRVEQSLWFHAALGVLLFVVLAGTVYAVVTAVQVVPRALDSLGS